MVAHAARQRALDYMHAMVAVLLALACSPSGEKRALSVDSAVSSTTPTGAGSSAAGASTADTAAGELPPNVLLVLLDDVGVDKVGAYGAEAAPPTPTLDALAAEGVRFTRAYAYPVCTPSRAALLTGRYGRRTRISDHIITVRDRAALPADEVTLAELVDHAPRPWATAALGKWHLSGVQSDADLLHPLQQGFEHYAGHMENLDLVYDAPEERHVAGYFRWQKNTNGTHAFVDLYATTDTVEDALAWVAEAPEPWLAFVSFAAPHAPWHVPPERFELGSEGDEVDVPWRYDAALTVADRELGRLLEGLGGLRERTLVIAAGDNGTPGEAVRPPFEALRAKSTVAEGGIHVPLIVSGPGVSTGVSPALVHLVDIWPTVAEHARVDIDAVPVAGPIDGRSLWPQLHDPSTPGRETLFAERLSPNGEGPYTFDLRVVRDERYKLIERHVIGSPVTVSLHDLSAQLEDGPDLLEGVPTAESEAARDRLLEALAAHMADFED